MAPLRERRGALLAEARNRNQPGMVWRALAECGSLGALIPPAYGGSGEGLLSLTYAMEASGATGYPTTLPILTSMAVHSIAASGDDEVRAELLPRFASGEARASVAATEAESGTNMFRIGTQARSTGSGYELNGRKFYVSGFDVCEYSLVLARTRSVEECASVGLPNTAGLSVFLVDASAPGIRARPLATRGEPGLTQFELELDGVAVPARRRIGPEDLGAKVMFGAMNLERILGAALALGVTRHALETAVAHAKERIVFGKSPIGSYQAVQHPLADVRIREEAVRLLTWRAAQQFDISPSGAEVGYHANCSKYLASELCFAAIDRAIEVLGGRGFDEEAHVIHLLELARLFRTAPTSNNMILNAVAEHSLGLPRSYGS